MLFWNETFIQSRVSREISSVFLFFSPSLNAPSHLHCVKNISVEYWIHSYYIIKYEQSEENHVYSRVFWSKVRSSNFWMCANTTLTYSLRFGDFGICPVLSVLWSMAVNRWKITPNKDGRTVFTFVAFSISISAVDYPTHRSSHALTSVDWTSLWHIWWCPPPTEIGLQARYKSFGH